MKVFFLSQGTFLNSFYSICPKKPCKVINTSVSLRASSDIIELPSKYVAFNFQPTVIVTRSIPKVTTVNVINDIGSSLGLWLGASAFSIFKMIPTTQTFCSYRRASRYLTLAAATVATFLFLSFGVFGFYYVFLKY